MRLGIRLLDDVTSYNSYRVVDELSLIKGNSGYLYFQVISIIEGCDEGELRYIPTDTAEINIKFLHIDSNKEITRAAEKAFPNEDRSIWRVEIQSGDEIAPDSIYATMTDGGTTQRLIFTSTLRTTVTDTKRFYC